MTCSFSRHFSVPLVECRTCALPCPRNHDCRFGAAHQGRRWSTRAGPRGMCKASSVAISRSGVPVIYADQLKDRRQQRGGSVDVGVTGSRALERRASGADEPEARLDQCCDPASRHLKVTVKEKATCRCLVSKGSALALDVIGVLKVRFLVRQLQTRSRAFQRRQQQHPDGSQAGSRSRSGFNIPSARTCRRQAQCLSTLGAFALDRASESDPYSMYLCLVAYEYSYCWCAPALSPFGDQGSPCSHLVRRK